MDQPQHKSKSMVFVLVVSAILLAVATFLIILLITSRNNPDPTVITPELQLIPVDYEINGTFVTVLIDPNKQLILEGETQVSDQSPTNDNTAPASAEPTAVTPTNTPPPQPTPRPNPIIFINYTVVAGDTLYSIAESQNSSVALMAAHGFDANNLTPGNTLVGLPVANPAYCPAGSRAYVVRDKDTVFSIASRFNTTVDGIATLNQLDAQYHIDMTQVICIPT